MKINNILIPVDFSDCSANAVQYALDLNKVINGKISIINAYQIPVAYDEPSLYHEPKVDYNYKEDIEERYKLLKAKISQLETTEHNFEIVSDTTINAIVNHTKHHNINLIIMGTHGTSSKLEELVGTTTYDIIDKSLCPVLAIPSGFKFTAPKTILLATDYIKVPYLKGMNIIYWLSENFNSEIHLLNVGEQPDDLTEEQLEESIKIHEFFEDSAHAFHFIQEKNIAKGINEYINEHNIDILAIMPKRRKIIDDLFHKSVTRKMVHQCKVPLLTFHE